MEGVNIPEVTKIAEHFDPIMRRARYLLCLRQFDKSFRNEKTQLESTHASVKERAEAATKRNEAITKPVRKWLEEVENILREVQKLEQRVEEAENKCFHVSFRYSLAKQVASKTQQMMKLRNDSKFEPFSLPDEFQGTHYSPPQGFLYFKSRESAYNELLQEIKDGRSNMIGLYGIGGSGKTTLAKEVGKKIEEFKLHHKVIMTVVSQPLNIKNIQDQISDQLGLNFCEQSIQDRALQLSQRLRDGRTLIILDDVLENINLEYIGIPINDNKGCCVMLTTRFERLCVSMGCQSKIELSLLTDEEAWSLFKLYADMTNDFQNELKDMARNIANECKGLPLAIVTVGSTLREKDFDQCNSAFLQLQNSQLMEIDESLRSLYACLKLSYDYLGNHVAKSLFLLCSMFPKDYNINKEELVRFGKGILELGETADTMEEARREIYVAINVLLHSCLLMPTNKQECVKMHDLVRDVALRIAAEQGEEIVVDSQVAKKEIVKGAEVISLWDLAKNFVLSNHLHCPTLKILQLHSEEFFKEANTYLGGMEALKVLALVRSSFLWDIPLTITWSMPRPIESLKTLHTLCLRGGNLGDISIVFSLQGLEILDLRGSSFDKLPAEVVHMEKLKLLDLFGCKIEDSPYEVIGRCRQLQELYIWDPESLSPENVSFPRLQRYAICVSFNGASMFHQYREIEASRALCIEGYNFSTLNSSMKDLCLEAEVLCLENCMWDDKELFSRVKYLMLEQCPGIKFFADNTDVNLVQGEAPQMLNTNLSSLALHDLRELEFIWKGPTQNLSLQTLEEVELYNCPKLKTIFTPTIVTRLPELRGLYVSYCNEWEGIISGDLDSLTNLPASSHINVCFPKLTKISISFCNKLKSLFSYSLASHCPSLTELTVGYCSELELLVHGFEGGEHRNPALFPKLSKLRLTELPKLTHVLSGTSPTYALPSTSTST